MPANHLTLIPGFRCSTQAQPEVRAFSAQAARLQVNTWQGSRLAFQQSFDLLPVKINRLFLDCAGLVGELSFEFVFLDPLGQTLETRRKGYRILETGVKSTTLLDGCWLEFYHWEEPEGRYFNRDVKRLTDEDWKEQVRAMSRIGIQGAVIQNVFYSQMYAYQHSMDLASYNGRAFYPSLLYPERYPITAQDPLEAVLSAADELGMDIFVGVGLFAWFDYSPISLEWHQRVTRELYELYGHHPSLYGWYLSEEMFGSLYDHYPPVEREKYRDVVRFFESYRTFVDQLSPTKPIALAPNNIQFHEYAREWKEILPNIDILLPFAFARDPEHLNITEMLEICSACGTRMWVDMEIFGCPFDNGLQSKSTDELLREIRVYDQLEQVYGYMFTGLLNPPESPFDLGGEKAKALYRGYQAYYRRVLGEK